MIYFVRARIGIDISKKPALLNAKVFFSELAGCSDLPELTIFSRMFL